ncbi:hypothetical protein FNAPI_1897 [Fusarium napiforme]|uniref:Uncharacterized protein n=1 Tax=Fusarium napiforme TaxID=42672 RepID=A0A8H5JZN5_9HYPO|nr:hypothetical protein FNAPI_1897 [Fusarium napiforme]
MLKQRKHLLYTVTISIEPDVLLSALMIIALAWGIRKCFGLESLWIRTLAVQSKHSQVVSWLKTRNGSRYSKGLSAKMVHPSLWTKSTLMQDPMRHHELRSSQLSTTSRSHQHLDLMGIRFLHLDDFMRPWTMYLFGSVQLAFLSLKRQILYGTCTTIPSRNDESRSLEMSCQRSGISSITIPSHITVVEAYRERKEDTRPGSKIIKMELNIIPQDYKKARPDWHLNNNA